ncbi:hypothetical protein F4775DRAFT_542658 [Biscogniauxia sp. FL1348]|nr:hypothetical protein F4775DRAFT_542658 [Biscogniauxia sp. FL1348]
MHATSTILSVLVLSGRVWSSATRPGFIDRARRVNQPEPDDFVSYFLSLSAVPSPTTISNTTSTTDKPSTPPPPPADSANTHTNGTAPGHQYLSHPVGDNDKIPVDELPECYQTCFNSECCNGNFGDVHDLTKHEFCETKRFFVGHWMVDHLQFCTGYHCRSCGDPCRDASTEWLYQLCGHGM